VSDGRDNFSSDVIFLPTLEPVKKYIFFHFRNKKLQQQNVCVFSAEILNIWPFIVGNTYDLCTLEHCKKPLVMPFRKRILMLFQNQLF
jgi:hypothetical protein